MANQAYWKKIFLPFFFFFSFDESITPFLNRFQGMGKAESGEMRLLSSLFFLLNKFGFLSPKGRARESKKKVEAHYQVNVLSGPAESLKNDSLPFSHY